MQHGRHARETAALSDSPDRRAGELLRDARRLIALRRTEHAIPLLNEALGLAPGNAELRHEIGALALRQGNIDVALAHLEAAVSAAPQLASAWTAIGSCHMFRRRYAAAAKALVEAARRSPPEHESWWRLARALRLLGQEEPATEALRRASAGARMPAEVHHEYALQALGRGRVNEAAEAWREVAAGSGAVPVPATARARLAALETASTTASDARRVAFHIKAPFHENVLKPGYLACMRRHHVLVSHDIEEIIASDPEVVVGCDTQLQAIRALIPQAIYVQTRHGMGSKGHAVHLASGCDYICLSSPSQEGWFRERGALPRRGFWPIGYLQLDPLLDGSLAPARFARRPGKPTVLFAPTIGEHVSGLGMLGDDPVARLRPDPSSFDLVIKPHPETRARHPGWMKSLEASARRHPGVALVTGNNQDILPWVLAADLMVTDVSSVMFFMVALDRPLVLLSNPARHGNGERFDPGGPEWLWRSVGTEVEDAADLPQAIGAALASPGTGSAGRRACRAEMFGDLVDGRAGERLAERIAGLAPAS